MLTNEMLIRLDRARQQLAEAGDPSLSLFEIDMRGGVGDDRAVSSRGEVLLNACLRPKSRA